jgi:hypothetical protein
VNYSHITKRTEEKLVVMVMEEMSPAAFRCHQRRRAAGPSFFFFLGPPGREGALPWIGSLCCLLFLVTLFLAENHFLYSGRSVTPISLKF